MAIEEALRLYPPIWIIERHLTDDIRLGDYTLKQGSRVTISPYTMQRHGKYWRDAEKFDPQRFTKSRAAKRPKCAYIPFGYGPRACIGKQMAMLIAETVVATLLKHVRFELVPHRPVVPQPLVTLKPKPGMVCRVRASTGSDPRLEMTSLRDE